MSAGDSATLLVGGYWSQREESRSQCADRLFRFIERIVMEHILLSRWYKKGRSRKQAMTSPLSMSVKELERLLKTNNRDSDRTPIVELGFSFDAWNGNFDDPASLSVRCGIYSKWVGNAVSLELPRRAVQESSDLSHRMAGILLDVWNPERTVVEALDGTRKETLWPRTPSPPAKE